MIEASPSSQLARRSFLWKRCPGHSSSAPPRPGFIELLDCSTRFTRLQGYEASAKAKLIREMFGMFRLDPRGCLPSQVDRSLPGPYFLASKELRRRGD